MIDHPKKGAGAKRTEEKRKDEDRRETKAAGNIEQAQSRQRAVSSDVTELVDSEQSAVSVD